MNAVTPKPKPQAVLLIFTLIRPFIFFLSSQIKSQVSHSKNTLMSVPGAAGAATPEYTRIRSFPGQGNLDFQDFE